MNTIQRTEDHARQEPCGTPNIPSTAYQITISMPFLTVYLFDLIMHELPNERRIID